MDLKLWEYIFEMFNYKIRQKKSIFSKLQTLTPPLNAFYDTYVTFSNKTHWKWRITDRCNIYIPLVFITAEPPPRRFALYKVWRN